MNLRVCNTCHKHLLNNIECPDCIDGSSPLTSTVRAVVIGALLGFNLTACGEKEADTASSEPSSETEPAGEPLYGVTEEPED